MRRMLPLAALAPAAASRAEFTVGPSSEAVLKTGFGCHAPAKADNFVFTRYAP